MYKKAFFIGCILSLFFVNLSQAQFRYGLRGGVNSTQHSAKSFQLNDRELKLTGETYLGLHVGFMAEYSLFNFYVQPELLFHTSGIEMSSERLVPSEIDDTDILEQAFFLQAYNRLDMPIIFGYQPGMFRIGAGPLLSLVLSNSFNLNTFEGYEHLDYTEDYNRFLYGYQIAVGINLSRLTLDVKYEGLLNDFNKGIDFQGQYYPLDTKPNQLIISLGLYF